jgi:Flp pilus assembly protein CpaB
MRTVLCCCSLLLMAWSSATNATAQDFTPTLPKGTRAVAFKVSRDDVALAPPGSRVDILAATKRANGNTEVKVLEENVLVLAVDEAPADAPDRPTVITVALTPAAATRVSEAAGRGMLRVVLRPPTEGR